MNWYMTLKYTMYINIPVLCLQFCYNNKYTSYHDKFPTGLGYNYKCEISICNLYYDYLLVLNQNNPLCQLLSKKKRYNK